MIIHQEFCIIFYNKTKLLEPFYLNQNKALYFKIIQLFYEPKQI